MIEILRATIIITVATIILWRAVLGPMDPPTCS